MDAMANTAEGAVALDGAEAIVAARELRRRYGTGEAAIDALAGVSVAFPKGRSAAIMGPSGSGKSTLMHILAANGASRCSSPMRCAEYPASRA